MDLDIKKSIERKRTRRGVEQALKIGGYRTIRERGGIVTYQHPTGDTVRIAYTKKRYGHTSDAAHVTVNEFWFDSTNKPLVTVRFSKEAATV